MSSPKNQPKPSTMGITVALLAVVVLFALWLVTNRIQRARAPFEQLPISIQSNLAADYQAEPQAENPGTSIDLIFDAMQDQEPGADLSSRKDGVVSGLLTPVPSITPLATYTPSATPTATPTSTPTATPTNTPTPTPTSTPTSTPTNTLPPTPTITPIPINYIVQAGDTLGALAYQFNVSVDAIIAANPGILSEVLLPNKEILIPGTSPSATPTP